MSGAGIDFSSPSKRQWMERETESSSKSYAMSGKIMLAAIVVLFVVVVFLVILHLYARWYLLCVRRRNQNRRRNNRRNRSTRLVFFVDPDGGLAVPTGGLDASVLKSLPLFIYSSETDGNMPECAVCLSEFEEGEKGRILPKCKHSFHTECIDMWFHSNSTCPLCRSPVEPVESDTVILVDQSESLPEHDSSTSICSPVQHDREHSETTSLADRRKGIDVRIDVPTRSELVTEAEFRLPSPSQGFRSPGSGLSYLKRILSMNISIKSPGVSPSSGVGPSHLPLAADSYLESARAVSAHESTRSETA